MLGLKQMKNMVLLFHSNTHFDHATPCFMKI